MEEVYVVRHRHLVEGVPIRRIAREMGIDRNTVRRYLRGAPAGIGKPRGVLGANLILNRFSVLCCPRRPLRTSLLQSPHHLITFRTHPSLARMMAFDRESTPSLSKMFVK